MTEEQRQEISAQKEFLMAKINEITDGVAPGYGEALLEELMGRLEKTVADFNEEVSDLLETLKSQSAARHEKLKELIDQGEDAPQLQPTISAAESEMSDWEKRLESESNTSSEKLEQQKEEPKKKEKPKKRGFFSRKKKNK